MTVSPTPLPLAGSPILAGQALEHALTAQTRVLTTAGECAAGDLRVGQRIITRDFGAIALRGLITRTPCRPLQMVDIPAHAFGHNKPEKPITVLAKQPILIRDARAQMIYGRASIKIAATRLVDGTLVRHRRRDPGALVALHFSKPAIVYANGLEVISAGVQTVKAQKNAGKRP